MIPSKGFWNWQLLASSVILGRAMPFYSPSGILMQAACILGLVTFGNSVLAQVTPDGTLGAERSTVTSIGSVDQINGGATRGSNLFHSFEQFSVLTGREAHFHNAADIQNIISRVTGSSTSNIDGLLQANASANLVLVNPNGIIFGPNASLNIGGSFLASTASSLIFENGIQFSATAPEAPPLLTINVPIGLQFGATARDIRVEGFGGFSGSLLKRGLGEVQPGETLALVGGDIMLEGAFLGTPGGRTELGSVAGAGLVDLNSTDQGWAFGYKGIQNFGDIQLSRAFIDASIDERSSDIQVQGDREAISIRADQLNLRGTSIVRADTFTSAPGGDVTIEVRQLTIQEGASVSTGTFGAGSAGTLTVNALDSVNLVGRSARGGFPSGLSTGVVEITEPATGDGGRLMISTRRLSVQDGAQVSVSTAGAGDAGDLIIRASEAVEVSRGGLLSGQVDIDATGNGGNLTIETGQLIVRDGAQVSVNTSGAGSAGILAVNASESVELSGTSASNSQQPSGLLASVNSGATGNGGNLTIETGRLTVRNGAQIQAATLGSGSAGRLVVSARESVELIGTSANGRGSSGLFTATAGVGDAGDLTIKTGQLTVRDGAEVTVSSSSRSRGSGKTGNLQLTTRVLVLDSKGAIIARTRSGNGGDITLQVQDLLLLRRNSSISTRAGTEQTSGTGGSITIFTDNLVAVENSDIDANAFGGPGGQVRINASGIFGTEGREQQTPESDITASSDLGPQFSGTVAINTPDVDPSQGLATLPSELVDVSGLIAQTCPAGGEQGQSEFIVTGRGGLPPNSSEALSSEPVQVDWVTLNPIENRSSSTVTTPLTALAPAPLVEAQGWVINNQGEVVLTATAHNVTPHIPWLAQSNCQTPQKTL